MAKDYYSMTVEDIEKEISRISDMEEDRPDALTRAVIFMGQLDFAKHIYHDKGRSPRTRLYKGGSVSAEISSFGQALVQLLLLIKARNLGFDRVFEYGIEHLKCGEWKDRRTENPGSGSAGTKD